MYDATINKIKKKYNIIGIETFIKNFTTFPLTSKELSKLKKKDLLMIDSWCLNILNEPIDNDAKVEIFTNMINYYKFNLNNSDEYLNLLLNKEKFKDSTTDLLAQCNKLNIKMNNTQKQIDECEKKLKDIIIKEDNLPYEELTILRSKYKNLEEKNKKFQAMYNLHQDKFLEIKSSDTAMNNISNVITLCSISLKDGLYALSLRTKITSIIRLFIIFEIMLIIILLPSFNQLQTMMEIACIIMSYILSDIVDRILSDSKDKYYDKKYMDDIQNKINNKLCFLENKYIEFEKTTVDGNKLLNEKENIKNKLKTLEKRYNNLEKKHNDLENKLIETQVDYETSNAFVILSENKI